MDGVQGQRLYLFGLFDDEFAADVLWELHDELREELVNNLGQERLARIVSELDTDEGGFASFFGLATLLLPYLG
ncbi:MAG: hypothetical protein K8R90_04970 [Candidatus Cloacimonetes bacterium]|nr:hypothetical protein [Candidatus Cloacimonadota bacterium]